MKDGLLLIDKHGGCTSHDIVASARRILRQKKIGHCGTLDPTATGLLLLTLGRATRLTRFLIRAPKIYEGSIRFGLTTDTYDLSGQVTQEVPYEPLDRELLSQQMESFLGQYLQTPPPYCAKKVNGVKYYELARRGEETPQEKKEITIYDFHAKEGWDGGPDLDFVLGCSSGTYARSLAHELGQKMGTGAVLDRLRRTRIGNFRLEDAIELDELRRRIDAGEEIGGAWLPFDEIPLPFAEVVADPQQERRIQHGQTVLIRELEGHEGDWVKVLNRSQRFIAVGSVVERIGTGNVGVIQPKVVFQ